MENKILLLGSNGQLGSFAKHFLSTLGNVVCFQYPEIDFTYPKSVCNLIQETSPDIVFNAVAYTDVDKAEEDEINCNLVNAITPGKIAKLSKKNNFIFFHYSTDFVFDGLKQSAPYHELDEPNPLNIYGNSKLMGEKMICEYCEKYFIFRTSWLYSKRATSFLGKVIQWSRQFPEMKIVDDQIGSPTSALDLSWVSTQAIGFALAKGEDWIIKNSGIFHLGGKGETSRFNWAKKILELDPDKQDQVVKKLTAVKTKDFPLKANRPLSTPLSCTKFEDTFNAQLPDWVDSLEFLLTNY